MREVTKPGASRTTTTSLPMRAATSPIAARVGSLVSMPRERLQRSLQVSEAIPNPASVGFELRLARPPSSDAASQPRQRGALPRQAGQQVVKLRQLDLNLPFTAMSPAREDVQDHLRPIDDFHLGHFRDRSDLGGRQILIEDEQVRAALQSLAAPRTKYRLVGIALGDLVPATEDLFDQRTSKALAAMDAIIEKHGGRAIRLGEIPEK